MEIESGKSEAIYNLKKYVEAGLDKAIYLIEINFLSS